MTGSIGSPDAVLPAPRSGEPVRQDAARRAGAQPTMAWLIGLLLLVWEIGPARADLESFNRWAYGFNVAIEEGIVRPAASQYRERTPTAVQFWIGNAYDNLVEPVTAVAHVIDLNARAAVRSTARFAINSTLGLLGSVDVANRFGLSKMDTGFSEAVCRSGIPLGRFVVLPIIGATTAGIAVTAGALMIGSTYLLSLASMELAMLSVGIDLVGSAAALENTVKGTGYPAASYESLRDAFVADLASQCNSAS